MQTYTRYIARSLAHSTLIVALSLTSIVWLTQALRLMDFMVNQGIGMDFFLLLTVLALPSVLIIILPVALLIAVLLTYHRLKQDSELTVLESAGISHLRLAQPALIVACGVMVAGFVLSLYLMPRAYREFKELQFYLKNNYASVLLQEGVFNSPMDGLTVYVRERDAEGNFKGILVYDNRNREAVTTMMAEEGRLIEQAGEQRFLLLRGNRQQLEKNHHLSLLNFDSYTLDMDFYSSADASARKQDPRELYPTQLMSLEKLGEKDRGEYIGELHERLIWPLLSLCLPLVALAVLLSGQFNRRGNVKRVAMAALMGAVPVLLIVALRKQIGFSPAIAVLAYVLIVAPAALAWYKLSEREGV